MDSNDDRQTLQDEAGNVLLRARNGDAVQFDETGQILKLSDQVVADLKERLSAVIDAEVLGDIDAWDVRQNGDWFHFNANMPGMAGPRGYRRQVAGGDVIAETPGPVLGILSLGGARRAGAFPGRGDFPYHVVSAADEVGAVGLAGIEAATATSDVQLLREQTSDSMLAAEALALRQSAGRGLPLIVSRTETDISASVTDLTKGAAFSNLLQAVDNLSALATSLGKQARLGCISLDFVTEDVVTPAADFSDAFRCLMSTLEKELWTRGFAAPVFLSIFDASSPDRNQLQFDLALFPAGHRLVFSMPSYALEMDAFARMTKTGMTQRAMTEAAALAEIEAGTGWQCPVLLLAEWQKTRIRVRSNSALPLMIDPQDPFKAGSQAGFRLHGPEGEIEIKNVKIDGKEPRDLILRVPEDTPHTGLTLSYAWEGAGALRDCWQHPFEKPVKRWALPAKLEVHG